MESDGLKALIRAKALEHGFDLCRFARPDVSELHQSGYQAWVAAGMHGDMGWMAEESRVERRKRPDSMLDDVQAVITVGMRHTPPPYSLESAESEQGRGVIASYAHGNDYHDLVKKRLKALARDLDEVLGKHAQRVYVDTAPVLEHALAENAGLGWQGKHSLTINKKQGSWMMLGEVFTTAEIEPDKPADNHCGTCTACMDICPTKAIVAPYVVDARLCISYLTIEFDGFIPRELRSLMGNHIFGCDDCQMVCPWNRYAVAPDPDLLVPREENLLPELTSLLQLDDEAFRQRFRKSPVKRTGRGGLLRNVCIAMGNSGDAGYVPALAAALTDTEALIRGHTAWALGQLASRANYGQIGAALEQRKQHENDVNVLEEITLSIRKIRDCYDQT
jgi:epoxyqueuosine reductase